MKLTTRQYAYLEHCFAAAGFSLDTLLREASEVVIFGSFSAGVETTKSDIDILLVDYPEKIHVRKLDLVYVPSSFLTSPKWLTSELAIHIAHYGIWLKGRGEWRKNARIAAVTLTSKKEQILVRWSKFAAAGIIDRELHGNGRFSRVECLKLRRDIQRLYRLNNDMPTPPTALLVRDWKSFPSTDREMILDFGFKSSLELLAQGRSDFINRIRH